MTDTILLTVPSGPRGAGVVALVLGGLGSRLDLPGRPDRRARPCSGTIAPSVTATRRARGGRARRPARAAHRPARGRDRSDAALRRVVDALVDRSRASGGRTASGSSSSSSAVWRDDDRGRPPSPHRPPRGLPPHWRPRGTRSAGGGDDAARPLARAALRRPRRAGRGSRPGRRDRPDQGDRPLRSRARRRALDLCGADDRRRDPAPLPRPLVGRPRATTDEGAVAARLAPRRRSLCPSSGASRRSPSSPMRPMSRRKM